MDAPLSALIFTASAAVALFAMYRVASFVAAVWMAGAVDTTDDESGEGGHVTPPDGWGDGR